MREEKEEREEKSSNLQQAKVPSPGVHYTVGSACLFQVYRGSWRTPSLERSLSGTASPLSPLFSFSVTGAMFRRVVCKPSALISGRKVGDPAEPQALCRQSHHPGAAHTRKVRLVPLLFLCGLG